MKSVEHYAGLPYREEVVREDCTDGTRCYFARVVELPGCESHGETPQEALRNLQDARRLFIETLLENGVRPSQPMARPPAKASGSANQAI